MIFASSWVLRPFWTGSLQGEVQTLGAASRSTAAGSVDTGLVDCGSSNPTLAKSFGQQHATSTKLLRGSGTGQQASPRGDWAGLGGDRPPARLSPRSAATGAGPPGALLSLLPGREELWRRLSYSAHQHGLRRGECGLKPQVAPSRALRSLRGNMGEAEFFRRLVLECGWQ